MPLKLADIRQQLIITLYDFLQSSDEDSYWYYLKQIRGSLDPEISGAMAKIAMDGLVSDGIVERGHDDDSDAIYSLTVKGIRTAEEIIEEGRPVEDYALSPSADLILDISDDAEKIAELTAALAEVKKQLAASNAAANLSESDRSIIESELESAAQITQAGAFRLRRVAAFIVPALRFISEKFIGTSLGEAAKHLIKLLLG